MAGCDSLKKPQFEPLSRGHHLVGLVGIVAGPLVVAVGMTMIEIYRSEQTAGLLPSASDVPS